MTRSGAREPAADALASPEPPWPLAEPPLARPLHALAIDTTSDVLSLALLRGGVLAGTVYEPLGRRTTQAILPRIAGLLTGAALGPRALETVVVARGPGSFTGTRIGMAVALTWAQVTGRPLVGVDTLRVMAAQTTPDDLPAPDAEFAVLLNCARDEVYHARYRWEAGGLARTTGIALAPLHAVRAALGDTPVVLRRYRPGAGTHPDTEAAFAALHTAPLRHPEPDGVRLLAAGLGRYGADPACAGPRVEPIYLKSEAFRTWQPPAPVRATADDASSGGSA